MITKIFKSVLTIFVCFFIVQTVSAQINDTIKKTSITTHPSVKRPLKGSGSADTTLLADTNLQLETGEKPGDKKVEEKGHNYYAKYGISFISGSILVFLLWFLRSRKKNKEISNVKKTEFRTYTNKQFDIQQLHNTISEKNFKIREMQATIDKLQEIIKRSEITISELDNTIEESKVKQTAEVAVDTEPVQNSSNYLYFPSPLSDGSFRKIDGKQQFLEGASIYRFNLISDTEASFEFCDESSSVSMALNNRSDLILSVAEEMEGASAGAKKILTYKGIVGQALLEDNKWIVIRKVQIKYG